MKTEINRLTRVCAAMAIAALMMAPVVGCESDDGGMGAKEDKFAAAIEELNPDWILYEISENRGALTIKVETPDIVDFKNAKKAVEAIQKVDPSFKGYIDFFDTKTGMVVRKMEIIPAPKG